MEIALIGILGPMILNFVLLFNRKKKWALSIYKWYAVLGLLLISLLILGFSDRNILNGKEKLIIWGLMTPTIFCLLDYFFKTLSQRIHNRDLYLWIRGSEDIDSSKLSGGAHVRASDRVFSMILLFSVALLPLIILIFREN